MILNLDPDFAPFPQKQPIPFEAFTFSGGEPHIKIKPDALLADELWLSHRIRSFADMGLVLLAVDALRRMGAKSLKAFLPYFPGARQDRVMVPGEPLSVKVYADLINQLNLDKVCVFDPHSEVTAALLDNCQVISNFSFIQEVLSGLSPQVKLISPDGGALKKIYKLAGQLKSYEVIECSKVRDVATGKLSAFRVYADDLHGQDCLIVDDICDGGGTFMGLAQELKKKGAGNLYLAVSHGIFSRGLKELGQHFTRVFATDSFSTIPSSEQFQQIPLAQLAHLES